MIEVQNRIVAARFRDSDYRSSQSYVGETVAWQKERIHRFLIHNILARREFTPEGVVFPISARKRASHFDFLLDEEVTRMEPAVLAAYGSTTLKDD